MLSDITGIRASPVKRRGKVMSLDPDKGFSDEFFHLKKKSSKFLDT
jgi:hypothetical protein